MRIPLRAFSMAGAIFTAACGGGTDAISTQRKQSAELEAQAITLASDSPCSEAAQCSNLTLASVDANGCTLFQWRPYSIVAPTAAAAQQAASQQLAVVQQLSDTLRTANAGALCAVQGLPPAPQCSPANRCIP